MDHIRRPTRVELLTTGYLFVLAIGGILAAVLSDELIHRPVVAAPIAAAIVAIAGAVVRSPSDRDWSRQLEELREQGRNKPPG